MKGFKKLKFYYPHLKLYILGEGEEKAQLQELISKLGLNDEIKLMGFKMMFIITCRMPDV